MSDEKLSEGLEKELQGLAACWAIDSSHADNCKGCIERKNLLANSFRPLLARLERERDAARSEALAEVVQICEYAARGTVEAMSQADRSEMWKIIAQQSVEQYESIVKRIRSLSPSVVSQPSREREVPNQPAERCLEWLGPFQCERNMGHSESCRFDSSRKRVYSQDELKAAVAAGKKIASVANEKLCARIRDYLSKGGLFNPEAMNGDMVRDLIMDCYAALAGATPASTGGGK